MSDNFGAVLEETAYGYKIPCQFPVCRVVFEYHCAQHTEADETAAEVAANEAGFKLLEDLIDVIPVCAFCAVKAEAMGEDWWNQQNIPKKT